MVLFQHHALKAFADCWADIDDSMSSGCDYYCGGKRLSTKKREHISWEEAFNEYKKLKLAEERKALSFVAQDSFLVASPCAWQDSFSVASPCQSGVDSFLVASPHPS